MFLHYMILLSSIFILSSCKTSDYRIKFHELGFKTLGGPKLLWHTENNEEFKRYAVDEILREVKDEIRYVDADSAFYRKFQSITNNFDSLLRQRYAKEMKSIPQPVIKIIDNLQEPEVNAFAHSLPVCYDVPFLLGVHKINNKSTVSIKQRDEILKNTAIGFSSEGDFSFSLSQDLGTSENIPACVIVKPTRDDFQDLLRWINENQFDKKVTECRLDLLDYEQRFAVLPSSKCRIDASISRNFTKLNYFYHRSQGNIITVHKDLIDALDNDNLVSSTIAHELAHYYLTHSVKFDANTSYFYDLKDYKSGYPERVEKFERIGKLLTIDEISPFGPSNIYKEPVEGLYYQPTVHDFLLEMISEIDCNGDLGCRNMCQNLPSANTSDGTEATERKNLIQTDKDIYSCLALDFQILEIDSEAPYFLESNKNEPFIVLADIVDEFTYEYSYLKECTQWSGNIKKLSTFANELSKLVTPEFCDREKVLKKAQELKIGYYTYEQEADDIALEILDMANIPVQSLALKLLKLSEGSDDPGCRIWQEKNKNSNIPYLEDYSDPHHEICFRWNEVRNEIKRHKYKH